MRKTLAIGAAAFVGSLLFAPTAHAGPLNGDSCADFDKLGYDASVGQIVCDGTSWIRSVEPTGIRNLGEACSSGELDKHLASSTDVHLIWCPTYKGVWTLYSP